MHAYHRPHSDAGADDGCATGGLLDGKGEIACAWSGAAFCVVFGIGFLVLARFVPPPSPALDAAAIAALYADHRQSPWASSA